MNPEYIRLCSIPAVQEKIREKMGEWKWGDAYFYDPNQDIPGLFFVNQAINVSLRAKELRIEHGDDLEINHSCYINKYPHVEDLWEMVEWHNFKSSINEKGNLQIWIKQEDGSTSTKPQWHSTPAIALLRALMWQWGIKEEKE